MFWQVGYNRHLWASQNTVTAGIDWLCSMLTVVAEKVLRATGKCDTLSHTAHFPRFDNVSIMGFVDQALRILV